MSDAVSAKADRRRPNPNRDRDRDDGDDAATLRNAGGVPTTADPRHRSRCPARADRRSELLHRQVSDPAVPAAALPGRRDRVRGALGDPRRDQRDRDRLRAQPERLERGRVWLDAVHAREPGSSTASTPTTTAARTPTTRSTRSSPPRATSVPRASSRTARGDLRVQPRRLVRRLRPQRARLIAGLPVDLVSSLTGLTQGRFPVFAKARYADDLADRAAQRPRSRDGGNAARRGRGRADASRHRHPRRPRLTGGRHPGRRDRADRPAPSASAALCSCATPTATPTRTGTSTGSPPRTRCPSPTRAAEFPPAQRESRRPRTTPRRKERLYASPSRPEAYANGGEQQLARGRADPRRPRRARSYLTSTFGLDRSDVVLQPLREGSQVIAGTILGRIAAARREMVQPYLRFEIRPAGAGAPRIDPKPILDGWKLLESTASTAPRAAAHCWAPRPDRRRSGRSC